MRNYQFGCAKFRQNPVLVWEKIDDCGAIGPVRDKESRLRSENWCGRRESNPHGHTPNGFSYQLRLSPPSLDVCGLDYPFTIAFAVGAARLVSTPSLSGLARDCHVRGFPEFGQFCVSGFPREHSTSSSPLRLPFRHARLSGLSAIRHSGKYSSLKSLSLSPRPFRRP